MEYVTGAGTRMPILGLGTWQMHGESCRQAVLSAMDMGYRHIDTAQMYRNEDVIGAALHESEISPDDVFITTKILSSNLAPSDLIQSFRESLRKLQTDYVDLLLIHSPSPTVPIPESIDAMNQLQSEGVVRHIGVSNFSVDQTKEAEAASEYPIVTNQVQYHPFHSQTEVLKYCIENDKILTAYTPLAKGRVARDSTLREIGESHDKTGAQIALRWLIQQEQVCVIPKAADPHHLRENLEIFDFRLSSEEMERIFDLQSGLIGRLRSLLNL